MPYLKIVKQEHKCHLPTGIAGKRGGRGITAGTVWQCPECKLQWMLAFSAASSTNTDGATKTSLYWRKMEPEEYLEYLTGAA